MKKPLFNNVLQVGVVVKDLYASLKKYYEDYGIGPWVIYEFNPSSVKNMIIRGKRVDYAMRLALCNIGTVQWELIEPLDDISVYAEFLKKHGEGIHHCSMGVDSYKDTAKGIKELGNIILQEGVWFGFTYTYFDTEKDLSFVAEIYDVPEGWQWPEPDDVYPRDK